MRSNHPTPCCGVVFYSTKKMKANKEKLEIARKEIVEEIKSETAVYKFFIRETDKTEKPFLKMEKYSIKNGVQSQKPIMEDFIWDNQAVDIQRQVEPVMTLLYNISKMPVGITMDDLMKNLGRNNED